MDENAQAMNESLFDKAAQVGLGMGSSAAARELRMRAALNAPPTAREKLQAQRDQLVEAVHNVDEAIAALDANPGAEQVMNALRKVGI